VVHNVRQGGDMEKNVAAIQLPEFPPREAAACQEVIHQMLITFSQSGNCPGIFCMDFGADFMQEGMHQVKPEGFAVGKGACICQHMLTGAHANLASVRHHLDHTTQGGAAVTMFQKLQCLACTLFNGEVMKPKTSVVLCRTHNRPRGVMAVIRCTEGSIHNAVLENMQAVSMNECCWEWMQN